MNGINWRERVTQGAAWLVAARLLDQLFRIARLIILARLLLPETFGLLGVALVSIGFLQTFSETGVQAALVQRDAVTRRELDAAWTLQLIRGLALAALGLVAAPWVANFFDAPAAAAVLRWMMLAAVVEGVSNVAVVHLQRTLSLARQCFHQLAGTVVDLVASVSLAWILRDVQALIWGYLLGQVARLLTSYWIVPYLPRLRWDPAALKELWSFGRWMLLSSALVFLANQGDDIFVGKVLGITLLAAYQLAYRLASLPAQEWSRLVTRLLFPLLSRLRDQPERMSRAYLQALQLSALGAFPCAVAIFLVSESWVAPILGPNWVAVIAPLQVLAFAGLVRAIVGPGPLLMAVGKPHYRTLAQGVGVAVLLVAIVPLTLRWGLTGAALAAVLRTVAGTITLFALAHRELPELSSAIFRALAWPALAVAIGATAAGVTQQFFPLESDLLTGGVSLILLFGGYYASLLLIDRWFGAGFGALLKTQWETVRASRAALAKGAR